MANPNLQGTFTTGSSASTGGVFSDVLVPPTGSSAAKLTIQGLDASNTVKTQKRTTPGGTFVDQVTYNANQTNVSVPVTASEEWRLALISAQPIRTIAFKLSCES